MLAEHQLPLLNVSAAAVQVMSVCDSRIRWVWLCVVAHHHMLCVFHWCQLPPYPPCYCLLYTQKLRVQPQQRQPAAAAMARPQLQQQLVHAPTSSCQRTLTQQSGSSSCTSGESDAALVWIAQLLAAPAAAAGCMLLCHLSSVRTRVAAGLVCSELQLVEVHCVRLYVFKL